MRLIEIDCYCGCETGSLFGQWVHCVRCNSTSFPQKIKVVGHSSPFGMAEFPCSCSDHPNHIVYKLNEHNDSLYLVCTYCGTKKIILSRKLKYSIYITPAILTFIDRILDV